MCTLIVLNECIDGYPLVIAANRDERYDRPSSKPREHMFGDQDVIMPHDLEQGGTWIGMGRDGWFVGLTNQDDGKHESTVRSRGQLVVDCLMHNHHYDVAKYLHDQRVNGAIFNPFNLVFGRPGSLFLCRWAPEVELEMQPIGPGIHAVSNDCLTDRYVRKLERANELVRGHVTDVHSAIDVTFRALSDHASAESNPFQALCVHAEAHAFGTRSTSIITVSKENDVEYWYSEGHPCQSDGPTLVGRLIHSAKET